MRSIFAKVLVSFLGILLISLTASILTSVILSARSGRGDPFYRTVSMQLYEAQQAYEKGGAPQLQTYLNTLSSFFPGEHYVTDGAGRDLISGVDHSALILEARQRRLPFPFGRLILHRASPDGKYSLISIPNFPSSIWNHVAEYAWILGGIALLCYVLALNLASPLHKLRGTVERFGNGDLAARIKTARKDEVGDLSRAFDQMADRIETLLTAERRLLQDVSHELRSPLARLGFAIELARTSSDRESALARIKRDVDRLSILVGELLQVTRVEGDPSSRNLETIPLHLLMEDLVDNCSLEAAARQCRLVFSVAQPVLMRGDRELLHRALENVLRNAIRHAPEGSPVEVGVERSNDTAKVTVRDYGSGVPEESLADIFKPFFRVESDRNRSSGGVGLGLAITQRAVNLHHGNLRARNMAPGLMMEIDLPVASETA